MFLRMIRGVVILLICGTFIGAMMPSSRAKVDATANADAAASKKGDWGSAAVPLASNSSSRHRSSSDWSGSSSSGSSGSSYSSGPITLERASNGHFFADAEVNGTKVHFLVDTGASDIALTRADAQRAGVSLSGSSEVIGNGASGEVMGQVVTLSSVRLGSSQGSGIEAMVLDGGKQSLLGQSFLSKFASVEIRGDTMTLR